MVDLAPFSDLDFDARSWINVACRQVGEEKTSERYLAELEMKLQLMAEDVEAVLASSSTNAMSQIPTAVNELSHVKGDVAILKSDVQRLLEHLADARMEAEASVAALAQIDRVKTHMEAAYHTLKEATELSALFLRVESVFASTDVAAMGESLASMRRSLRLVGQLPELEAGMQRLQVLEDRYQGLLEGSLAAAFLQRRGEAVEQLVPMMLSIGRSATVEKLCSAACLPPLQTFWDAFDPKAQSFAAWVPAFYSETLAVLEAEMQWLVSVLPKQAAGLATAFMAALFARTDKSARMRIAAALAQGAERAQPAVAVLIRMQNTAASFAHSLSRALTGVSAHELLRLLRLVHAPFEAQIARYGDLEAQQLNAQMGSVPLPDAARGELELVVSGLASSVAVATAHVQSAAERCGVLTDFTEMPALLQAADQAFTVYIERLGSRLRGMRKRVLDPDASSTGQPGAEGVVPTSDGEGQPADALQLAQESAAALPMLNVAGGLVRTLELLDASLRATVVNAGLAIDALVVSEADRLQPTSLRLTADEGKGLLQLRQFVSGASDARYQALPHSLAAASAFQGATSTLIYDVLMIKVKAQLEGLAEQPVWNQAPPANKFKLPAFSAYPGPYITAVGEYLMMLPTLLESVLVDESEAPDEESHVDGEWLDKVAAGASSLYVQQLQKIKLFSPLGNQQLAADMEYFCNVLAALSVALPLELISWVQANIVHEQRFAEAGDLGIGVL